MQAKINVFLTWTMCNCESECELSVFITLLGKRFILWRTSGACQKKCGLTYLSVYEVKCSPGIGPSEAGMRIESMSEKSSADSA